MPQKPFGTPETSHPHTNDPASANSAGEIQHLKPLNQVFRTSEVPTSPPSVFPEQLEGEPAWNLPPPVTSILPELAPSVTSIPEFDRPATEDDTFHVEDGRFPADAHDPLPSPDPVKLVELPQSRAKPVDALHVVLNAIQTNAGRTDSGDTNNGESLPSAIYLLRDARRRLLLYRTVQARIQQRAQLNGREMIAEGHYVQDTPLKLRYETKMKVGTIDVVLQQVSDGQVMWNRREVGANRGITRHDIRQVMQAFDRSEQNPAQLLQAELAIGGLPTLLARFEGAFDFDETEVVEIKGRSFHKLSGRFQEKHLKAVPDGNAFPENLPDAIEIYIETESLFPRRIVFQRHGTEKDVLRTIMTTDFTQITLNAELENEDFIFVPPDGVIQEDITNHFVTLIKQAESQKATD